MSPGEARRVALLAFGGVEQTKERHRDGWGIRWIHELVADGRYALRVMRRNPVLAGAAIVTLALGIGANTAIFSAVNAVILRPLPFAHPDRLVMLWESNPEYGWHQETAAPANVLDWRAQVRGFQDVAAYADFDVPVTLSGAGAPRLLRGTLVTGNFFSVLGVPAEAGRMLRDAETWDTGAHVAVISDRLWRNQFGSDPAVAGRSVMLNGRPVQIVGVAPPSFNYPSQDVDVWAPVRWNPADRDKASFRRAHWLRPIARLQPGVTLDEADAQLQIVVKRLQIQYPAINRVMGAGMTPLHAFLVRDTRQPLTLLLAAVALLLLIACANVGNLLLVQAEGRDRESALRLTLGAGRWRLVRQALTESLMLSAIGGAAGLLLGWWGTQGLLALQPAGLLPVSDVGIDWRVLTYVVAATTASGLLFGTAPALWNSRRVPADVLREGGRTGSLGGRIRRWGNALVVGEVAIALLLTVGAGLLVRSFRALEQVDPGFDPHGVLTVRLDASGPAYDTDDKVRAFYDELIRRARALPGVASAAAAAEVPLTDWGWTSQFVAEGWPSGKYGPDVAHREVTPGYFRTMHVPIVRGRAFTEQDGKDAPKVVLINQALARQYFPDEDPIGKRVTFDKKPDAKSTWHTIVGIVGDEHQTSLGAETKVQFMEPFAQDPRSDMTLVLRTGNDPAALARVRSPPGLRPRPESRHHVDPDDGRDSGGLARPAALPDDHAAGLCVRRAAARHRRGVWRDGTVRPGPDARDGHPAGARRSRRRRALAGHPPRPAPRPGRTGPRGRDGARRHAGDAGSAVPRDAGRPGDLRGRPRAAALHGGRGDLAAGRPGEPHRPGGDAAGGVGTVRAELRLGELTYRLNIPRRFSRDSPDRC